MVKPMTWCPSARSIAATVEESTPPDIATAMVLESGIVRSFCPLYLDAAWTDPQHLFAGHEEQPIVVSLVGIVQIIRRRNHQSEISENKRGLEAFPLEVKVRKGGFLKTSNRDRYNMAIGI